MTDFDDSQFDDFDSDDFLDDNIDDEFDDEFDDVFDEEVGEKKKGNRSFVVVVGALVAVFLVTLIAMVVFAGMILPQRNASLRDQAAQINQQNTQTVEAATAAAVEAINKQLTEASKPSPTLPPTDAPTEVPPTATIAFTPTEAPTNTEVIAEEANTPEPTASETLSLEGALGGDPARRTETVAAHLTQLAGGQVVQTESGSDPNATPVGSNEQMTTTPYPTIALPDTGFADELGLPGLIAGAAILLGVIVLVRRLRMN